MESVRQPTLEEQIERLRPMLIRNAAAVLRNHSDAEDAVQNAILRALDKARHLGDDPMVLRAWLKKAVFYESCRMIVKEKRTEQLVERIQTQMSCTSESDTAEALDVRKALRKVNEPFRTVLVMKYCMDLTQLQIAEVLGIPLGTVQSRLHTAKIHLKLALSREAPSGGMKSFGGLLMILVAVMVMVGIANEIGRTPNQLGRMVNNFGLIVYALKERPLHIGPVTWLLWGVGFVAVVIAGCSMVIWVQWWWFERNMKKALRIDLWS